MINWYVTILEIETIKTRKKKSYWKFVKGSIGYNAANKKVNKQYQIKGDSFIIPICQCLHRVYSDTTFGLLLKFVWHCGYVTELTAMQTFLFSLKSKSWDFYILHILRPEIKMCEWNVNFGKILSLRLRQRTMLFHV